MRSSDRGLSRRNALRLAGAAGLAGVFTIHPGRRSFASADQTLDLLVQPTRITIDGRTSPAISMGGTIPAPTLYWREGQEVVIRVTNRLAEPTSMHWHGLLLEGVMDGAPGFNGYEAIPPGGTYTYRLKLRQAGTYWYHSHSAMQEQAGMYGAIVIEPAGRDPIRADRDYVVLLSDHTPENPAAVMRHLKVEGGYYNYSRRTLADFFRDTRADGGGAAWRDRLAWGEMRMDPTDLADVTGYTFLVNGKGPKDNWTALYNPGERVRLRIVNASAMTIFDVRIPGLPMTVMAADGQNVLPVKVDEFRFGVGETYDVIVMPTEDRPFTFWAESIDRSGGARATLATRPGMEGEIPPPRPRAVLTMEDMGHGHGGHVGAGQSGGHGADGHMVTTDETGKMEHGAAHDHHGGHAQHTVMPGNADGGGPLGWADAGTPPGDKALSYADLRSLVPNREAREPDQEIELRLTGMMERYIWTLNGRKFLHGDPIRVRQGERVRIRFVNTTMMAHPMHLHGMFMELENGHRDRLPRKHVVLVPPGKELSVVLTAEEVGEWPFHCHLLYHMAAGMMTKFIVEPVRAASL